MIEEQGEESIHIVHILINCECSFYVRVMDSQATNVRLVALEFFLFPANFFCFKTKAETKHLIVRFGGPREPVLH